MAAALADREADAGYKAPRVALTLADFELVKRLGDGSYSQVVQARHRGTHKSYALKIVDKHLIQRHRMVAYIRSERTILDRLDHTGIVRLCFTFQDAHSLYLGLELCPNGELFDQIQRRGCLPLEDTVFYTAEVVDMLAYLQQSQVVHRDLKPENLLLDADGHLKLIDFGSAKSLAGDESERSGLDTEGPQAGREQRRATSLVGTADYVAPETLSNEPVTCATDLWSLGCIVYQMLVGKPPFKDASEYLTFQRIAAGDYSLPASVPEVAADLIRRLLKRQPEQRLGAGPGGLEELCKHAFFEGVNWEHLWECAAPAITPPPDTGADQEEGVDWEMSSLAAALPATSVTYTYEPTDAGIQDDQEYEHAVGLASSPSDQSRTSLGGQPSKPKGHSPKSRSDEHVHHSAQRDGQAGDGDGYAGPTSSEQQDSHHSGQDSGDGMFLVAAAMLDNSYADGNGSV